MEHKSLQTCAGIGVSESSRESPHNHFRRETATRKQNGERWLIESVSIGGIIKRNRNLTPRQANANEKSVSRAAEDEKTSRASGALNSVCGANDKPNTSGKLGRRIHWLATLSGGFFATARN